MLDLSSIIHIFKKLEIASAYSFFISTKEEQTSAKDSELESPHNNPEIAAIDATALQSLWEMMEKDEAAFTELLQCYLAESPRLVKDINAAVRNQDAQTLRQAAHQLKSSSAYVGATILAQLSRELEAIGKSCNFQGSEELILKFEREYERVKFALNIISS